MITIVTIIHIFICLVLISVVLLQQGKGADAGATFGGGGNTVFGASGADNFLSRATTSIAILFMVTSLVLASNARKAPSTDGALFEAIPERAPIVDTDSSPQVDPSVATEESPE